MSFQCRTWEVVVSTVGVGYVYLKQNLTQEEACDFIHNSRQEDGTLRWKFPDGEMFFATAGVCVIWSRVMYDHRKKEE